MSVIHNDLLLATDEATGYNLTKSLRFRSSASAYLSKAAYGSTQLPTWTYSAWVKRGTLSGDQFLAVSTDRSDYYDYIALYNDNRFGFVHRYANTDYVFATNAVLRDPSAWYHLVIAIDTTQATATNRVKLYVNGVLQTLSLTATITQNQATRLFGSASGTNIGGVSSYISSAYFDGYLTEVNFIDGQALTPSSFGETDATTGVWKPKAYSGTYGTNGFYLKFDNLTSTSTLGNDSSGNSNTWTVNNISLTSGATYDSMKDVPTLTDADTANYAVLNPLTRSNGTLSDGNLTWSPSGDNSSIWSSIAVNTGKWYFEMTKGSSGDAFLALGQTPKFNGFQAGEDTTSVGIYMYYNSGGSSENRIRYNATTYALPTGFGNDDTGTVYGVTLDFDTSTLTVYRNNDSASKGTFSMPTALTAAPLHIGYSVTATWPSGQFYFNFGQQPFTYTPPTGYVALNTYNLPDSTIVAGNKYMDATTFTSSSGSQNVVNAGGFKPDLIWQKNRSGGDNFLTNTNSGISKYLKSNQTDAENTLSGFVTSVNSNGYTVDGNGAGVWFSGYPIVAWQWQAGQGTTSSNTAGSITSTVSVNASAGFSIVTWTSQTSTPYTVGHGLGVAPALIMVKFRGITSGWNVYHQSLGATKYVTLNTTDAATTSASRWNDTAPTSSVFTIGSSSSSTATMVAYCWSEIAGFSKFGSFVGNGSADGPFIFTGFKPKFVMIKATSGTLDWEINDSSRNPYNVSNLALYPNLSAAETSTYAYKDLLSNGFKIRTTNGNSNTSGTTYIYAAFAENPFRNALAA